MKDNPKDRELIWELGRCYAEIAALPAQKENRDLWRKLNGLKPVRPMLTIDQIPWHEMNIGDELTLQTRDPFLRDIERTLRRTIYLWNHMPADSVVEPYLALPKRILGTGFRMSSDESTASLDGANDVVGHEYHNQFDSVENIQKIQMPDIRSDEEGDRLAEERAADLLSGVLPVRMVGATGVFALWDRLAEWMSPERILYDLVDRPEFIHAIMERYTEANLAYIDQMEAQGLFEPAQSSIHCSPAYCDDLPATGFDPAKPRARDSWTFGMAQIFATVSPAMHEEFEIEYVKRIYERFGLVYYGCCEPLHDRIDVIRKLPNVRKISCSPWCDIEIASEKIGKDYVVSRKPSPAWLASASPDWSSIEAELRRTLVACRRSGSPVEFILKDISTVMYRPQNLWEWEKRANAILRE
jgi:hypothetical protein